MAVSLSVEDRLDIAELIMAAAWANDSANSADFVALFAEDGTVQHSVGAPEAAREFAEQTFSRPGRKGRQHYVQIIAIQSTESGAHVKSYWMAWQWLETRNEKKLHSLGFYDDRCVKVHGRWRLKSRRMYRCSDATELPPW